MPRIPIPPARRPSTPGVKHTTVQTRAQIPSRHRRMNYWSWPPEDSSPLHPIEPWGRQFFVFNAFATISPEEWLGPRGASPRLPPKMGVNGLPIASEPVMCITDFARRPQIYLSRSDFERFAACLVDLKEELKYFGATLKKLPPDRRYDMQRLMFPRKTYTMQRTKHGEHHSWGTSKSTFREPKT